MLPDLYRERERLSHAAADLLAARDRPDTLIETTARLDPADPSECDAVVADRPARSLA